LSDVRTDASSGATVVIVGDRQSRPNQPDGACPFCPGGLEAPDAYDVRWFVNRYPPMPDARCEVVLYTPEHEASFASLGLAGARKVVDLWAERTAALGARSDVAYVLVFENRGAEVGATIAHPHGQIYAFDHLPLTPAREGAVLADRPAAHDDRFVAAAPGWQAWVPHAPAWPIELRAAPDDAIPDLPSLDDRGRDGLASILVDVLARLDRLFATPLPYMLWIHQRPFDRAAKPPSPVHVHIVSPWRDARLPRFIAAGELGSGVYFNPVSPEAIALRLRAAAP
jgi:UDPglucose--hexose-1-phosphate uridylyltransferase